MVIYCDVQYNLRALIHIDGFGLGRLYNDSGSIPVLSGLQSARILILGEPHSYTSVISYTCTCMY